MITDNISITDIKDDKHYVLLYIDNVIL